MRMTVLICVVGALLAPTAAPADSATVIAATATSMGPHAAPVNCLLQPDCAGSWSPGSADSGANEGVYVQFETPVAADSIELVTSVKDADAPFTLSVNGEPHPAAKSARDAGSGKYARSYATPGGRIKSIFFRLGVRKGGWQNFSLYSIQFYRQGKPVELTLPVLVPATVVASSVLEPKVAYQPANLFDSRYDFAWSTNGQTTSGKGESVEIRFSQPQSLSGMIVWNGYQRSETHFKANGRVARISVSDGHVSSSFALSDTMGGQQVAFTNPLKNVSSLKLTIESVTAGAKYPDVLLSELRLLDDHHQILIPQVKGMQPEASPMTAAFVDRSFSSVVCASSVTPGDFQRSLRLRGDGSFVIYGKAYDDEEKKRTDQVLEGNWELRESAIRIFGKRYSDTVLRTEYSQTAHKSPPSIFQSELRIVKFLGLTPSQKQQLAALIWARIHSGTGEADSEIIEILGPGKRVLARGADERALLEDLVKALDGLDPWTVSSPVLADAMLPSDDVGPCGTSF